MRVLVALFAAFACVVAKPAADGYAYSALTPWASAPWAGLPYGAAYSPLAYSAAPALLPAASPALLPAAAPAILPAAAPAILPAAAPAILPAADATLIRAAPAILPAAAPAILPAPAAPLLAPGLKTQYHSQDELGQASYGHAEPGQTHNAIQDAFGNKVGSFSFINPEGKLIQTNYVADGAGYRVASNDLPVAPIDNSVGPAPIADTPEVAAAKIAHLAELEAAKSRSRRSAVITPAATTPIAAAPIAPLAYSYGAYPYGAYAYGAYPYGALPYSAAYPHAYPTTNTIPVVTGPNGYLADTPEVAAAKANHFAEVAAATARAGYLL